MNKGYIAQIGTAMMAINVPIRYQLGRTVGHCTFSRQPRRADGVIVFNKKGTALRAIRAWRTWQEPGVRSKKVTYSKITLNDAISYVGCSFLPLRHLLPSNGYGLLWPTRGELT